MKTLVIGEALVWITAHVKNYFELLQASNGYRLKGASFMSKTPTPKQRYFHLRTQPNQALQTSNLLSELANNAASKIVDAEAKSELAAEAVKEAEKISRMAEESDSFLQLAKSLFEQCNYKLPRIKYMLLVPNFYSSMILFYIFWANVCRPSWWNCHNGLTQHMAKRASRMCLMS